MIDKKTLDDIGFVIGTGWDHEVWYHNSDFWVHFGAHEKYDSMHHIDGSVTMKEFFEKFIFNITHG